MGDNNLNLPPGFRFYPTDEELVLHFLHRKSALLPIHPNVIPDLHLHPYDPWDLDGKAMCEGKRWYFYSRRAQSRITGNGYWQSIGIEEPVYSRGGQRIGMKKYSVFYIGEPWDGVKTNWIMHEYRVSNSNPTSRSSSSGRKNASGVNSKWVVCRVSECGDEDDDGRAELSCLDELFLSLDDLDEISLPN